MVKLTGNQRYVLARLARLPNDGFGFNPCSFGGSRSAATARGLASRGLVELNRISEFHIRYRISEAGRAALQSKETDNG